MIRKARITDLDSVIRILQSVGTGRKEALQGFLMNDYTKDEAKHRRKYANYIERVNHFYVLERSGEVQAFLLAFSKEEWIREAPNWKKEIFWYPNFSHDLLHEFVLINQTAMHPELTGKGLGSELYKVFFQELKQMGTKAVFAETIIAPVPNFASLNFRLKHKYSLVGVRYEKEQGIDYTTLVYYKPLAKTQEGA